MADRKGKLQLNMKQKNRLFYGSLILLALFIFLFVGSGEPVLFDDSGAYIKIDQIEGVMPVYPIFLLLNQFLFGLEGYLGMVVIEQAALAAMCVIFFVKTLRDEFHLHYWETYLVFFLSVLPFTTEMPQSMATQQILTEGLSYALFYLFVVALLKAVWTKKYVWFGCSLVMTFVLAALRSQLQILFAVCGVIFLYMVCSRKQDGRKVYVWIRAVIGIVGGLCICLAGIFVISKLTAGYKNLIKTNEKFSVFVMKVQSPEDYETYLLSHMDNGKTVTDETSGKKEEEDIELALKRRLNRFTTSQYVSLIFSRGMYEADSEDVYLFEDEVVRGLYVALYEAADAEKQRYAYAQSGLWMWKDIVGGVGQVGKTCLRIPSLYYAENYPEIVLSDQYSETRNAHLTLIGLTLLKAHFGRFLYHTFIMLPQAFICTVFFQVKPIYLLCHLVTLFLYLSALALMVWGFIDRDADQKCAEFMALILGSNVVMVVVISLVFFGQQRYLVYNFGAFYIAYYLLLRELWNGHIRDKAVKWFEPVRRDERLNG
ncbi:MAG: hypothetical protein K2K90_18405 [Lachnospiraceae bacterium]|nr:hypothetical protein [Lachnospiraceae bacterium]